jgi:hypothetical protein
MGGERLHSAIPFRAVVGLTALLLTSVGFAPAPVAPRTPPPLVGFSFDMWNLPHGQDPYEALQALLDGLSPDLVRLPVYWSEVMPMPDQFDFGTVDRLLATVAAYNQGAARPARVVLVAGIRNLGFPEVFEPGWLETGTENESVEKAVAGPAYRQYLRATFQRYVGNPLLAAWQIENEPLDNVNVGTKVDTAVPRLALQTEIGLLRSIDPSTPVVITTYNSSHVDLDQEATSAFSWLFEHAPGLPHPAGHPAQALSFGNALGLDAYVETPNTSSVEQPTSTRIGWKADTLAYWSDEAASGGKQLWVTEMQAYPWAGTNGFTRQNLISSALAYRNRGVQVVLLWDVEPWLQSSAWMRAGQRAIQLLRNCESSCGAPAGHLRR